MYLGGRGSGIGDGGKGQYTMLLKLLFQDVAESYAEGSESPECFWFYVIQDMDLTFLASSPTRAIFFPFGSSSLTRDT